MTGKWSRPGVPHRGWACVDVEDLGALDAVCDMCETQAIRYVHWMEHADFPDVLGVGCICAEHMANDYATPRKREQGLRNAAQRKRRWLDRSWKISSRGNPYLNTDGMNIVVYKMNDNMWGARIKDRTSSESIIFRRKYTSEDAAKLAAFDAMIFLKQKHH